MNAPAPTANAGIYGAEHAIAAGTTTLNEKLEECAVFLAHNAGYLKPPQQEMLLRALTDLASDMGDDAGDYGPQFNMVKFINGMYRSMRVLESKLYVPTKEGMKPVCTPTELTAITNSMKNLMTAIERNHEKIRGWERGRLVEEAHLEAARTLPEPHRETYLLALEAKLQEKFSRLEVTLP